MYHGGDQSTFYKWQCLISLAHVDGKLMREEQVFLREKIHELAPPAMHQRLMDEMMDSVLNPKDPQNQFYLIEDPAERVDLLHLAFKLFWADGDLDPAEQEAFDAIIDEINHDEESLEILKGKLSAWGADENTKPLKDLLMSKIS